MPDQVVICGGGIMGVATAYYLTLQGIRPTVVERGSIACAASGTACCNFLPQPSESLRSSNPSQPVQDQLTSRILRVVLPSLCSGPTARELSLGDT